MIDISISQENEGQQLSPETQMIDESAAESKYFLCCEGGKARQGFC